MITINDLKQITEFEWEIPKTYRADMNVPVRVFASRELLMVVAGDKSLEQAVNAATLPGLVGKVVVMPDMHQGYGFPIGGVAATRYPEGVISPGGIGYDINCGVRLLSSKLTHDEIKPYIDQLINALNRHCPSGVGKSGMLRLTDKELADVCRNGSKWALQNGYATEADVRRTEESGCVEGADPRDVSDRAKKRGKPQLGTVGAGNHFVEIDLVEDVFDEETARVFGLQKGNIALQIHCGSRGFGHQICSDYVREFQSAVRQFNISLPDRELVCAPLDSEYGQRYLSAMNCAANYAFANRQLLAFLARNAFESVLAGKVKNWHLYQVYDIAHNMGKIETHMVDGEKIQVCVHRKGATRAFGPGSLELPDEYRKTGQPVLVPGSMGTSSWVLAATKKGMEKTFGSCCHGAGRVMSRSKAKKSIWGEDLRNQLEARGIKIRAGSMRGLAEEAPQAYKDVDEVVRTVTQAGIAKKVVRLVPLAVIKG